MQLGTKHVFLSQCTLGRARSAPDETFNWHALGDDGSLGPFVRSPAHIGDAVFRAKIEAPLPPVNAASTEDGEPTP